MHQRKPLSNLKPLPFTQLLKFNRLPTVLDSSSSKFLSSHGSSMISRYHEVLKEKKQLLTDWQRIKSRLLRIRKEEDRVNHRNNIEQKRRDYLNKYRSSQHCVTAKQPANISINQQGYESQSRFINCKSSEHTHSRRDKSQLTFHTMHENFEETVKQKALMVKRESNFNQRFIEERRQIEFDRKLATAQTVKRHRQKKKESSLKLAVLKNYQTASQIQRKIHRELKQCDKIQNQVIRLYTAESSISKSQSNPLLKQPPRPKLRFQRIL